jgi:hypothetical protein
MKASKIAGLFIPPAARMPKLLDSCFETLVVGGGLEP